ncbi:unnamed protein product [Penicillium olsonii]|uniref:Cation/H+ exchanger transmembrane domain-containing protein n=1 Tax=Penicillium olsonii TaxID=99116 RepID=A0A9W4IJB7_PENOL|nr:unnamed protein product [Penicillium olsonii]CAG8293848.1 unnamed protein product [Penicillium olsonii]CAG8300120.1 unnamed protein product [Penicillium olsonii]
MANGFLPYHEPGIVQILIIISFFFFLSLAKWFSAKIIHAGIIGQIAVGIIYGVPLANILEHTWQETFLALGYVGLILIIFEGTTFAVISSASSSVNLAETRVGSVLVSAAVIDDVVGLVMLSVIGDLGKLSGDTNLGWLIGRPIVASAGMAIVTPIVTKWVFAPFFRKYIEYHFARFDHVSNIILMILVLSAFISIAGFTGTSVLFGAFLAGVFLTYIPSKRPEGPFVVMSREQGEREDDKSPTFVHTFEKYLLGTQEYLMEPLFFSSIGFAIPFVQLWTGKRIWRGIVYTLLMAFAKCIVGIWVPLWQLTMGAKSRDKGPKQPKGEKKRKASHSEQIERKEKWSRAWLAAALLGSAMVARGEIGLLIIEIGHNETPYVSDDGFITGVWAILLNTIIGPVAVGLMVRFYAAKLEEGDWGVQSPAIPIESRETGPDAV